MTMKHSNIPSEFRFTSINWHDIKCSEQFNHGVYSFLTFCSCTNIISISFFIFIRHATSAKRGKRRVKQQVVVPVCHVINQDADCPFT